MSRKEPQTPNPNDGLVAALILTRDQWIELTEAIGTKAARVRSGDYDEGTEEEDKKWAQELDELYAYVLKTLADQGIHL